MIAMRYCGENISVWHWQLSLRATIYPA